MLCAVFSRRRRDVVGGVRVLEVAKVRLLLEQALGVAHVAVEEHAHRQAQVGEQPLVQVDDLGHAGLGEAAVLLDLLVLDVLEHALDDVADLLHVDRERDDVGPAPALLLRQRLARDLRQVELDRRIELVDGVVELRAARPTGAGRCCGSPGRCRAAWSRRRRPGAAPRAPRTRSRATASSGRAGRGGAAASSRRRPTARAASARRCGRPGR